MGRKEGLWGPYLGGGAAAGEAKGVPGGERAAGGRQERPHGESRAAHARRSKQCCTHGQGIAGFSSL